MKGIKFNNIHSYEDLNLVLSSCEIVPAPPKMTFVDISGTDGSIDLTEAHGGVKYADRDGCKFVFTMHPSGDLTNEGYEAKKTEVSNALNGRKCKIILDKDSDYYYEGRCTVDEFQSDRRIRQIVVGARLKPYKMKVSETVRKWVLTSNKQTVVLPNGRKVLIPSIIVSDNAEVVCRGSIFNFSAGTHRNAGIYLEEGENVIQVSGAGTIEFKYREGDL